jgi:hypothetical protein
MNTEPTARVAGISPAPNPEEAAAIVAAVEAMWPRPAVSQRDETSANISWRFSGRWWASNHVVRRGRPGR